jgi:hypothetical protein
VSKFDGPSRKKCFSALYTLDNVLRRRIQPRPRLFQLSTVVTKALLSASVVDGLERMRHAVVNGEDLWPWLSEKTEAAFAKDGMLFDWRIHHLHLSKIEVTTGFRPRSDDLAFAIVEPDVFRVLDVGTHDDIGDVRLLEICRREWSRSLPLTHMPGVLASASPQPNAAGVRAAWQAGLQMMVTLSDGVYFGAGVNTTGRSVAGVQLSDMVVARVAELQQRIESRRSVYEDYIKACCSALPTTPRFHVEANDVMELTIYEAATGVRFPRNFAVLGPSSV